jgi:hypothetical protein
MAVALIQMLRGLHKVRQARQPRAHPIDPAWLLWWVVAPLVVAAWAFCPLIPNSSPWTLSDGSPWTLSGFVHGTYGWPAPPYTWTIDLAAFMFVAGVMVALLFSVISLAYAKSNGIIGWWCFLTGLAWGAMLYGVVQLIAWFYQWDGLEPWLSLQISATARMTTFGLPMLLMTMALAISLAIGLIKDEMGEELREWLASLCAALMRAAAAWAAVNLIALYGTVLVLWASPWVKAAPCSGWFLTVALGVLAGGSEGTGTGRPVNVYQERLARWSLPVFVVGILILVALLVHVAIDKTPTFVLTDDATSLTYLESDHPSSHISVTRTGNKGRVEVERKREYLRVTDDIRAIKQQYWLGMLNTGRRKNERFMFYLSEEDVSFLRPRLPDEASRVKIDQLRPRHLEFETWTLEEFEDKLDKVFPEGRDVGIKILILQRVRRGLEPAVEIEPDVFLVKIGGWLAGCLALL